MMLMLYSVLMRYEYRAGWDLPWWRRWARGVVAARVAGVGLVLAGGYVMWLLQAAPHRASLPVAGRLAAGAPLPAAQLVIGGLGVQRDIVTGSLKQLDKGLVVQRTQSGGDPERGGNFVLVGHRYVFDLLPGRVSEASVFYDLPKLKNGDVITVYWQHKAYRYAVNRLYQVKPGQVSVEAPSKEAKLTLYTCTLQGQADGRVVVEARPI